MLSSFVEIFFFFSVSSFSDYQSFDVGSGYFVEQSSFAIDSSSKVFCKKDCSFVYQNTQRFIPTNLIGNKDDLMDFAMQYEVSLQTKEEKEENDKTEDSPVVSKGKSHDLEVEASRFSIPYPKDNQAFLYNLGASLYILPRGICYTSCRLQLFYQDRLIFQEERSVNKIPFFALTIRNKIEGRVEAVFVDGEYREILEFYLYHYDNEIDMVQLLKDHYIVDVLENSVK